jgi:hypothetical protein
MKVIWVDETLTKAAIIKGWWRKKRAEVHRVLNRHSYFEVTYHWYFSATGSAASNSMGNKIENLRTKLLNRRTNGKIWTPVTKLPTAVVV